MDHAASGGQSSPRRYSTRRTCSCSLVQAETVACRLVHGPTRRLVQAHYAAMRPYPRYY
jgi:hypothetical protein